MNALSQHWLAWTIDATWQLALLVCIVAAVAGLARASSARLRHALWLLVLLKVFLPPWLWTPLSVGPWALAPLLRTTAPQWANVEAPWSAKVDGPGSPTIPASSSALQAATVPTWLMLAWAAGCVGFCGIVGWRYVRLVAATRAAEEVDEGPARVELERIAMDLGVRRVPDLLTTGTLASPFLFGALQPRIVLPRKMLEELSDVDLRAVLTHELVHWKRRDTWIGWLQLVAQSLFWFHPFLWWANRQLRHERECACDEAVLQLGRVTPQHYGEAIVRFLTASRGRSLAAGSLVGVFERGAKLPERLEHIMSYETHERKFGWLSCLLLAAFAIFFLPMSPGGAPEAAGQAEAPAAKPAAQASPSIVTSTPKQGAMSVDPGLQEISVTFDRDMDTGGMSWTGGPPHFPPVDKSRQARWTDARTCVLPVKIEKGSYYRLGINSTSHQNFRSRDGVAARPTSLSFTTQGASKEIEQRVQAPTIVELAPKNGANDVDPKTKALRVTFNMKMGEGMSWTGGGPQFPKIPDGEKPRWSADGKTCTLPVALEPNHDYQLGLNSPSHINFQSEWGVSLEPVVYKFRTRGAE